MTTSELLVPLRAYIADLQEQLSNCEWVGDDAMVQYLQKCMDYAKELQDNGDVYLPTF